MAVLIGFSALELFKTMQLADRRIAACQVALLFEEAFASLDKARQGHLLLIGEQIHPADVLQIQPKQICRAASAFAGLPCPSGLAGQERNARDSFRVPTLPNEWAKSSESFRDLFNPADGLGLLPYAA